MFHGCESELHRLSASAEEALRGKGAAVLLTGRSGSGKSSLLEALAQKYASSFRLLRVTGHPDEATLPFAAVERLLIPLWDSIGQLPGPQQLALRVLFGLEEGPVNPLLVHIAVTKTLQVAAIDVPLLILIDDFHLLDKESARVFSFLSRRIGEASIYLLCAEADGHAVSTGAIDGERLVLEPLDEVASLTLLNPRETFTGVPSHPGQVKTKGASAANATRRGLTSVVLRGHDRSCQGDISVPHPAVAHRYLVRMAPSAAAGAPLQHVGDAPTLEAAEQALALGDSERLTELLDTVLTAHEAGQKSRFARLQASYTLVTRSPATAAEQLMAAARMPDTDNPSFVLDTLNMAVAAAWLAGDAGALQKARGARARLGDAWQVTRSAESAAGPVLLRVLAGPRDTAARTGTDDVGTANEASVTAAEPEPGEPHLCGMPVLSRSGMIDDLEEALSFYIGLLHQAVDNGEQGSVPVAAYWAACLEAWLGRWNEAMEHVRLGLSSAERSQQSVLAGHLRSLLAWLYAALGDVAACRTEAKASLEASAPSADSARVAAQGAMVFAALSEGRPADVPELLQLSSAAVDEAVLSSRGSVMMADLIEAAYRTFEMPKARQMLDAWKRRRLEARACRTEVLMLHRCEALLREEADAMERDFRRVLATAHPSKFEQGRTRLLFGERLRRARRQRSAREELLAAVGIFRSVGAPLWADRAQRELDACAARPSSVDEGRYTLTAQERQVLQLADQGFTNRQIAQTLFISPRTVAYHLYKAFPKLNIHSRRQIKEVAWNERDA